MSFDATKPVQTRDGRSARIICTDMDGKYPIVAVIECGDEDKPWPSVHCRDGREWTDYNDESHLDLINISKKHWVNIYKDRTCSIWETRKLADANIAKCEASHVIIGHDRIACIEFTDGDGL